MWFKKISCWSTYKWAERTPWRRCRRTMPTTSWKHCGWNPTTVALLPWWTDSVPTYPFCPFSRGYTTIIQKTTTTTTDERTDRDRPTGKQNSKYVHLRWYTVRRVRGVPLFALQLWFVFTYHGSGHQPCTTCSLPHGVTAYTVRNIPFTW